MDLSFLLTGFLIAHLFFAEYERAGRLAIRNFYVRRTLRIFPAYYVTLCLLLGEVNRYTWVERGGSFVLSDLLAAILLVQLGRLAATQRARQTIGLRYLDGLQSLAANGRAQLPKVDDPSSVNWHTMYLLVSSGSQRDRVLRALRQAGIEACFHFIPLHSSPYGRRHYGYRPEDLPVTEDVARRLIRLPMYPGLAQDDQDYVIATLHTLLS